MQSNHPMLQFNKDQIISQIDVNKFFAQVAMGVAVAISVKLVMIQVEKFIEKRKA